MGILVGNAKALGYRAHALLFIFRSGDDLQYMVAGRNHFIPE